jgi:heat shock protein HslJ
MQIERQLAKTLPQVQSYRIQGRHLELLDSEGKRIVRAKVSTSDADTAEH